MQMHRASLQLDTARQVHDGISKIWFCVVCPNACASFKHSCAWCLGQKMFSVSCNTHVRHLRQGFHAVFQKSFD